MIPAPTSSHEPERRTPMRLDGNYFASSRIGVRRSDQVHGPNVRPKLEVGASHEPELRSSRRKEAQTFWTKEIRASLRRLLRFMVPMRVQNWRSGIPMNWFYALGGQQQGPVDDAQLEALTAAGTINPDTLVWREGMANWQPLRQARPVPAATPAMAAPPVMAPAGVAQPLGADEASCTECGNRFTKDNLIQY